MSTERTALLCSEHRYNTSVGIGPSKAEGSPNTGGGSELGSILRQGHQSTETAFTRLCEEAHPDITVRVPSITEEDAREALMKFATEHCCYGRGVAKNMVLTDLKSSSAFHYTMETFTETRSTMMACEPYSGSETVRPREKQKPFGPWDVEVSPPGHFMDTKKEVEIPYTATYEQCPDCLAKGRMKCPSCSGTGQSPCVSCEGTGRDKVWDDSTRRQLPCVWCEHTGTRRCHRCSGRGKMICRKCNGKAKIKCYLKCIIMWKTYSDEHIIENKSLPRDLIPDAEGDEVYMESLPMVSPITDFPEEEIVNTSKSLVAIHSAAHTEGRIIQQRQRVRMIPVFRACYKYKDITSSFHIYGFDQKIHAPDYPERHCCGCSII